MSGQERGGRIRRDRQHLPRNSVTPTSSPSSFSASSPLYPTSPGQRQQSATYSYPPPRHVYIASPTFPDLVVPAAVIPSIIGTGPKNVPRCRAAATTPLSLEPVTQSPEEDIGRAELKSDGGAEEEARSTLKKNQKKKYKRRCGRPRRKPWNNIPANVRASCGSCKRPQNHMMTPSKPPKKEKDEEKGESNQRNTDSDRESLICACDEYEEIKRTRKRNPYVEGETPQSLKDILTDLVH